MTKKNKVKKWLRNAAKEIALGTLTGIVAVILFVLANMLLVAWLG